MIKSLNRCLCFLLCSTTFLFLVGIATAESSSGIANSGSNKRDIANSVAKTSLALTDKEKTWLAEHKTIRVAFDGYFPPYSFVNDNGTFEGLAVDIFRILEQQLGVTFELSPHIVWKDLYAAAQRREVDVVSIMGHRPEREEWFAFTRPYIFKSLVIMTREETTAIKEPAELAGKRVALVKDYQYVNPLLKKYPSIDPYYVDTMLDGLNAVAIDKADAVISFLGAGNYLQKKYQINNLKFTAVLDRDNFTDSIGVRKDWPELATILDKALTSFSNREKADLSQRWIGPEDVPGLPLRTAYIYLTLIVGGVLLIVAGFIVWDRSKKKRMLRKAVQVKEQQLRIISESVPVMIAQCDCELRYKFVNQPYANLFNREIDEIIGRDVCEILDTDAHAEALPHMRAVLEGQNVEYDLDLSTEHNAGQRVVHVSYVPEKDLSGQVVGFIAAITDVTERKKIEKTLQRSEARLRRAEEIGQTGNWSYNVEDASITWSKGLWSIFGRSPQAEKLTYELLVSWLKKDFREYHDQVMAQMLKARPGDIIDNIIYCFLRPDGEERWVEVFVTTKFNDLENLVGFFGVVNDITERKKAEGERQELEIQLRQKYKMEAIGTLAGGLAHNFNNNLSIILGNLELSKMKIPLNNDIGEYLDYAQIATLRSRDLIKQIMTYSRKEALSQAPLKVSLLLEETLSLLTSTIPSSVKLQHESALDCDQVYILADASQIQECLLNLCNNAVQAMNEQGELTLTLKRLELRQKDIPVRYTCSPGDYLCLSVRDNGCGIPAEIQDKIFDPFFTTKDLHKGTGMGLATVQGIVEQHHGMIYVESKVGQGTTFYLCFPVIDQLQQEEIAVKETELQKGTERILLVDDDEMIATLNEQLLSEMGYQVTVMTDSVAALKLFTAQMDSFDIVMTDQTMPDLTGKELIEKIKILRPEIPTILCTGFSSKINKEDARQAGISAFLLKPIDFPELLRVIRYVLEK